MTGFREVRTIVAKSTFSHEVYVNARLIEIFPRNHMKNEILHLVNQHFFPIKLLTI